MTSVKGKEVVPQIAPRVQGVATPQPEQPPQSQAEQPVHAESLDLTHPHSEGSGGWRRFWRYARVGLVIIAVAVVGGNLVRCLATRDPSPANTQGPAAPTKPRGAVTEVNKTPTGSLP